LKTERIAAAAAISLLLLCVMITPASATTRIYAEKTVVVDWFHVGLVYPVSLQTNENSYIGGVDQSTLNEYAPEHNNVQAWDRRAYGSGKSVILIPKRYVLHRWNFGSEIYLECLSGQV